MRPTSNGRARRLMADYAVERAGFLAKNKNINWFKDGLTIAVRCVRPQRLHPRVKLAATQLTRTESAPTASFSA
jgi:hypothetical protein